MHRQPAAKHNAQGLLGPGRHVTKRCGSTLAGQGSHPLTWLPESYPSSFNRSHWHPAASLRSDRPLNWHQAVLLSGGEPLARLRQLCSTLYANVKGETFKRSVFCSLLL